MKKEYKIEYLSLAKKDLTEIFDYIAYELASPQAALRLLEEFETSIDRLSQFPDSCPVAGDSMVARKKYRVLVVENYLVFYGVIDDIVEIKRIIYNKRNYKDLLF